MKRAISTVVLTSLLTHAADPVVEYVTISQRSGTKLVDIEYKVTDADGDSMTISVIGRDHAAGADITMTTLSGDGADSPVTSGTHTMVWDAGVDWPNNLMQDFRVVLRAGELREIMLPIPGGTNSGTNPIAAGEYYGNAWFPWYPETYDISVNTFYMDACEVTRAKWEQVRTWANANGYTDLPEGDGKGDAHPVCKVNWYDVAKWCNARSEMDGRTPCYTVSGAVYRAGAAAAACETSATGYRLPTEAEWEYAARGGLTGKRFPWGDTIAHDRANYYSTTNYDYDTSSTRGCHPDYDEGGYPYTSPVGSFAANNYGLYDMAGNLLEWCWDWYGSDYYNSSPGTDPRGPASGSGRVIRGGYWSADAINCRVANRSSLTPGSESNGGGFRLVRAVP